MAKCTLFLADSEGVCFCIDRNRYGNYIIQIKSTYLTAFDAGVPTTCARAHSHMGRAFHQYWDSRWIPFRVRLKDQMRGGIG
eukprot:1180562-Prorocentrum_minimum.AAC.1